MARKRNPTSSKEAVRLLNEILACLRAQNISYQTSHWQSIGPSFYQDHLLFERLYNSVLAEIDTLAEKISGIVSPSEVSLKKQSPLMERYLELWGDIPNHLDRGLYSEKTLQELLSNARVALEQAGMLSLGLDDYLAATASAHETNMYLLQQSLGGRLQNPRRSNPDSSLGAIALAGLAGYLLGKKSKDDKQ
jgi:DNA-binding ferritin-like protein